MYDSVLNRPVAKLDASEVENFNTSDTNPDWKIHFISAQCPDCGWDLTGGRQSVVLFCKNCSTAWQSFRGRLKKLSFSAVPWIEKNMVFLPFWRMKVNMSGLALNSYADLIRIANFPRATKKEWEKTGIFFWAPAFKVQPRMFLRLSRQMTVLQPHEDLEEILPTSTL